MHTFTLRQTLFISDLHLEETRPDIAQIFFHFLNQLNSNTDAVYILGDLFEAWIGDDDKTPFHCSIIEALKKTTSRGIPIYFLYGNRDFLIGKRFLKETGCKLIDDEAKIEIYGRPLLLMHGDTLCTRDTVYLKARKKGRNRFYQFLYLSLPLKARKKIAMKMRAKSTRHTKTTAFEIMDVTQEEVVAVMKKHGVPYLIHGHTHRPAFHQFQVNQKDATRIVLGAWHSHGSVLVWDETGNKSLIEI